MTGVINGTSLSVNNQDLQSSFAVYPNPSNEIFNITWTEQGTAVIVIYDYTGKSILKKTQLTDGHYTLNLNGFSKGLYFAKINVNGKQATKKNHLRIGLLKM